MKWLDKLNENQKRAVLHTEGPLLILAGAGSGKTRVITYRIAYLVREKQVPPYRIMAVTFTNKASGEMKNRVADLIGPTGQSVFVKTFHSASVYILRRHIEKMGMSRNFSIYDQKDQESLIKDILVEMRLDPKAVRPSAIASKISEIKDRAEMLEGVDLSALAPKYYAFDFADLYRKYQERLRALNAFDFNDLLIKTVELLRGHPEVLAELQKTWTYFMIDEYQDTNYAQYLICKYLASKTRNLCVVGDEDQSIYSWRGANIKNILNFERDYEEATVITLEENYRSTAPILEVSSSIIRNNINRKEKKLYAVRGDGEPVECCRANNEYGEAGFVINTMQRLKRSEGCRNSDFAVFYRTNAQSRVFEDVLRRENIPYRVVGGLKFYDRKEVKDIISYLRLIANPRDAVSLLRIINTPSRGIGAATIEKIRDLAYQENISEWEVLEKEMPVKGKMPAGVSSFTKIILKGRELARDIPSSMKLSRLVKEVIDLSGYRKSLEEEDSNESRSRMENIEELLNSIIDYEAAVPDAGLDQFLQDISLLTSEEDPDAGEEARTGAVTLMTVHTAKGLEFPVVFMTGMEEGIFPHVNASNTDEGIEEERRLCYVGITRAIDRAYLVHAEIRRRYGDVVYKSPSRFLMEIPEKLIVRREHMENGYGSSPARNPYSSFSPRARELPESGDREEARESDSSRFRVRDQVLHPRYGVGRIVEIKGKGDNLKLTINFGSGVSKTFFEKYTPLEKVH